MIRIGTRGSKLARVQAELVGARISELVPEEEIVYVLIATEGDVRRKEPLASFGGKGVFAREIEQQLLDGAIDIAVHSAKDLPMELPDGLDIAAVLEREDYRDVLLTTSGIPAAELPSGSVVGTGSLRRELQIKQINPMVQVVSLRGNVPTRIEKLRQGKYDAILLAAAGLNRLGLQQEKDLHYEYLGRESFLPAAGQGIVALEVRSGTFPELMERINAPQTAACFREERAFLKYLNGSCNAPCAVLCENVDGKNRVYGAYAADGIHLNYAVAGSGRELAEQLF